MKIPQEFENLGKRALIRFLISKDEIISQLQIEIEDLERRLLAYENSNTPPSKSNNRRYPKREPSGKPVGAPKGHKGTTRKTPEPTQFKELKLDNCPDCGNELEKPKYTCKKIQEDIPKQQPAIVTQFKISHYFCKHCNKEVVPKDNDLAENGKFGPNLIAQIALMKYEDRLPLRKIADTLNRQHNLDLTPATILDITERAADYCELTYDQIKQQIRNSNNVYADETGQKVQGKKWWTWIFTTVNLALFLITNSRGQKPIREVLGDNFLGVLNCDGWASYKKLIKIIQRCWAHLLREAKWYAEKYEGQARLLYKDLCKIFERIKKITVNTIQGVKTRTYNWCTKLMKYWINTCKSYKELKKFVTKIENGFECWFTKLKYPEIELTNNRAERGLREIVVQRNITGTLRNERGTRIMQILISVIGTWKLQGLNTFEMLLNTIRS